MFSNPSKDHSIRLLNNFLQSKMRNYDLYRNFDYGTDNYKVVSALSPYISHGVLNEEYILKKVCSKSNKSNKFIQEIFWRVYWKGWLENKTIVWKNFRDYLESYKDNKTEKLDGYDEATSGKTKIFPYNQWVLELKDTGYLHNHTRMWFASIWIHYLGLPWQLGAKLFLENLLDADPASNTLSWRWVAGLQTKNKKYIATEKNINQYTNNRFRGLVLPLKKNIIIEEENLPVNDLEYSKSINEFKNTALIIFENNFYPSLINNVKEYDIVILINFNIEALETSKKVKSFKKVLSKNLIKDMLKLNIKIYRVNLPSEEKKMCSLLSNYKVKNLVYEYLTVGYERDIFEKSINNISKPLIKKRILKEFYIEAWKNTRKGFFNFKKEIPSLIQRFIEIP